MEFYAVWPSLVCLAAIMLLASSPAMRLADSPPTTVRVRVRTIDGLRGFLALGVFFHHAVIYHRYMATGEWVVPPSRFYTNIGHAGVTVFFMITGYLFWMQMLRSEGRPKFLKIYIGRVFRIIPLYLSLAFFVLLTVGVLTRWQLQVSLRTLVHDMARWLAGGILYGGDVNRYAGTSRIAASVTWTLQYEWFFYASLLFTGYFARSTVLRVMLPVAGFASAGLLLAFHPDSMRLSAASMFLTGMIVATSEHCRWMRNLRMPQWAISFMISVLVALVLFFAGNVYKILSITALGIAFALVVSEGTIFGLLLTRGARRLGDISYGIYLLQGPVLFLIFRPTVFRTAALHSPWVHWGLVMAAALLLVALATLTHVLIEKPGVQAGRWVSGKLAAYRLPGEASPVPHL